MGFYNRKNNLYFRDVILNLGEYYYIHYKKDKIKVKLIQVTEFGYNLLNEETNCCILKRHMYVPKKYRENFKKENKIFFISDKFVLYKNIKGIDNEYYTVRI
jgi:hypothetical protein